MYFLAKKNPHKRDKYILFDEPTHVYTIKGDSNYCSVTQFNKKHFEEFDADKIIENMMNSKYWKQNKYYGMTPTEIKDSWEKNRISASSAGTKLHYDIECYYNNIFNKNDSIEFKYFKDFVIATKDLVPYRTEWMIWDEELKLAGSIDMVYQNPDGSLMIYDWKRSKEIVQRNRWEKYSSTPCLSHIPDTNFWHYALQLNTYKAIIERNYGKKVSSLSLVCLHPNHDGYQIIKVPDLQKEVYELFKNV